MRKARALETRIVLTVLLVEDYPINRKLFRDILKMQFVVFEAESAEIALEVLETCQPNVILLDMQLPGMDGLSLARLLKVDPRWAAIPIIGLSALDRPRDIQRAREAGCCDYITKPVTDEPSVFLTRIGRMLPEAEPAL